MATIEIKGIIGTRAEDDKDMNNVYYSYKQFITDYSNAKGQPINLFIDSVGGSVQEGNQIAGFIRSHSESFLRVVNSGHVASIAASIFLALPFEKRFFDLSKGVALIHNPMSETQGLLNADELATVSELLRSEQKNIQSYIAKQTGADTDVIGALMQINEPLSEAQLQSINFANIIKFQAVAYLKNNDMNKQDIEQIIEEKQTSFFAKLMDKLFPFKAIMVTDAEGNQIDFPEVPDGGEIKVGDKTSAPDGEVVMATGETYVIAGGVLTEIKPAADPETPPAPNAELDAAKAEIAALKQQLAGANAKASEYDTIKAQLSKFQSKMVNDEKKDGEPGKQVTNRFV